MNSSENLRAFLKDFLSPDFPIEDFATKWGETGGDIYNQLVANPDLLGMFGIAYSLHFDDDPYIFIDLVDKERNRKYHDDLGLYIYENGVMTV